MVHAFDQDPLGSVLEFCSLFSGGHASTPGRNAWEAANVKRPRPGSFQPGASGQIWLDPAVSVSKGQLLNILEVGRDRREVRKILDRVFLKLESEHLIEPFSQDDNLSTTYRVISPLGEDLLADGSYIEYIGGLPKVVERWRDSIVKIYHPTDAGIGTGYLIKPNMVATARHVIDGLDEFEIAFEDGTIVPHKYVQFPKNMEELDLAIVELATPVTGRRPFNLTIGRDLLDEVVIFGFPPVPQADDAYLVVHRGEISADITLYSQLQVLVVSCLLRGGNSGGPVVNRRGHVVGTVSQNLFKKISEDEESINEGLGFAAAIPSKWAQDLLDGKV